MSRKFISSKKGAISFHPQLAFCAETKEILQGWYRCGNAYTSNGIVELMQQLTAKLPSTEQFYFRADSGYFSDNLISYLEENGYLYLIKVKMKTLIPMLKNQIWSDIEDRPGWQESTFEYKCSNWKPTRIFKAVRLEIPEENPDEVLIVVKKYSYFCYAIADLELTPWEVHKKYGERATCETWIEEGKNQVALANIKMDNFEGASILFQCSVILSKFLFLFASLLKILMSGIRFVDFLTLLRLLEINIVKKNTTTRSRLYCRGY